MLKKILLSTFLGLGIALPFAFASADTVDGFTSSSDICVITFNNVSSLGYNTPTEYSCNYDPVEDDAYFCLDTSDRDFYITSYNGLVEDAFYISTSPYCFDNTSLNAWGYENSINFCIDDECDRSKSVSGKMYFSTSYISYSSTSGGDGDNSGSGIGAGLSNFSSSLTSLVGNFTGSISNYLPTLIMVGLGVVLLFTFRGVIKSWAIRIFSRKGR